MTEAAAIHDGAIAEALEADGFALLPSLVAARDCAALVRCYDDRTLFRSRIVMARHGFGRGEYSYFGYPLPETVAALRESLYPPLAAVANRWNGALGIATRFPERHASYLERCHRAGQTRPTPLLLRYEASGWNALHRDLYGPLVFPLQATVLLSRPGEDFEGGEFLLVEQRPRQQSMGTAAALAQGEMIVFPVFDRPVAGARGHYRAQLRHGVSRVLRGERFTLGLIFHDAA